MAEAAPQGRRIRLAVVDDSAFVRGALKRLFEHDWQIEVVGCAPSGEELLERLDQWAPDVITLDLNMPGMGGLATIDRIQETHPGVPVIVFSSAVGNGAVTTVEALSRRQVDFIDKQQFSLVDFSSMRRRLVEHIEALTEGTRAIEPPAPSPALAGHGPIEVVVIGSSTGGPPSVEAILRALGADLPVPMIIAQHMPPGFTKAFAERLNGMVPLRVREASDGDVLTAATVFIAPGGYDLRLVRDGERVLVSLTAANGNGEACPSVDRLFTSAANLFGRSAAGVLLSGMGTDGARGMAELHWHGAHTIAQDESTCVVYGMPRAAVALGAASEVTPLPAIGPRLRALISG